MRVRARALAPGVEPLTCSVCTCEVCTNIPSPWPPLQAPSVWWWTKQHPFMALISMWWKDRSVNTCVYMQACALKKEKARLDGER